MPSYGYHPAILTTPSQRCAARGDTPFHYARALDNPRSPSPPLAIHARRMANQQSPSPTLIAYEDGAINYQSPSPPSVFTQHLMALSRMDNPISLPVFGRRCQLAIDTQSEIDAMASSTIYEEHKDVATIDQDSEVPMDCTDSEEEDQLSESEYVARTEDSQSDDSDDRMEIPSPTTFNQEFDVLGALLDAEETAATTHEVEMESVDKPVIPINQALRPDAERLANCLGNPFAMVLTSNCVTRCSDRGITFDYPEVVYSGVVITMGSDQEAIPFKITDNQLPYPQENSFDFSPFFASLRCWHSNPRHKWNTTYSRKMALKPLWMNHPDFKALLPHAQVAAIASGRLV